MRRAALSTALAAVLSSLLPQPALGQQPQWRPSRIPENSYAQPLAAATHAAPVHQAARPQSHNSAQFDSQTQIDNRASTAPQAMPQQSAANGEQLGSGVVLRWKTVGPTAASEQAVADATRLRQQAGQEFAQAERSQNVSAQAQQSHATLSAEMRGSGNPLRSQVRQAAYQQATGNNGAALSPEQLAPPALPPSGSPMPSLPGSNAWTPPQFGAPQDNSPASPNAQQLPGRSVDPLQTPELPPPPGNSGATPPEAAQPEFVQPRAPQQGFSNGRNDSSSILEDDRPGNPFPPKRDRNSPSDLNAGPELIPPPRRSSDQPQPGSNDSSSGSNELKRRSESTTSGYCNEMRARIHSTPLTDVSLDISPKYGAGFRAKKDPEQQRLDFASSALVREWTDYRGHVLATGRLIDLRDDRVVIDVAGREQLIPVRDLSDVDVTYVGESWNIPERCGTGYDPLRGRNFVPSTVQWAASGLCHKPLYFEQVQLERYGHETGPVLQPLISTAHFFGNIAVLPYKMGIHPPNECQYALGYFRPGNCAPYMVQPIPWSLRGAAVQAAVVTGGAALIP